VGHPPPASCGGSHPPAPTCRLRTPPRAAQRASPPDLHGWRWSRRRRPAVNGPPIGTAWRPPVARGVVAGAAIMYAVHNGCEINRRAARSRHPRTRGRSGASVLDQGARCVTLPDSADADHRRSQDHGEWRGPSSCSAWRSSATPTRSRSLKPSLSLRDGGRSAARFGPCSANARVTIPLPRWSALRVVAPGGARSPRGSRRASSWRCWPRRSRDPRRRIDAEGRLRGEEGRWDPVSWSWRRSDG
jgi:hypothetical protein